MFLFSAVGVEIGGGFVALQESCVGGRLETEEICRQRGIYERVSWEVA